MINRKKKCFKAIWKVREHLQTFLLNSYGKFYKNDHDNFVKVVFDRS